MAEKSNVRPPRGPHGRGVERPKDAVGTFKRLLVYFKDYYKTIAFALICVAASSLANVASNYFLKPIINEGVMPFINSQTPDYSVLLSVVLKMLAADCSETWRRASRRRSGIRSSITCRRCR